MCELRDILDYMNNLSWADLTEPSRIIVAVSAAWAAVHAVPGIACNLATVGTAFAKMTRLDRVGWRIVTWWRRPSRASQLEAAITQLQKDICYLTKGK